MARKRNGSFPESVQPGIPVLALLPDGWKREPLGKRIKEIQRPVSLQDYANYNLVTVKRSRGGAVKRETLRGKDIKVKSQYEVHAGDFLISKRQIVHGACAVVPGNLHGAIVSNEYSVLNCKSALDINFLRYLSETTYFQQTCFHSSIGVHVEKMVFKLERWFKWEFNFPDIKEQQKIVRILFTWDAAIGCTQKLLENSRQQKKALMQQLLTCSKRISRFKGSWAETPVSKIGRIYSGGTPQSNQQSFWDGDILWATPTDITSLSSQYISNTGRKITDDGMRNSSAEMIPMGSLLVCTRATIGAVAISKIYMCTNQGFKSIHPFKGFDVLFLYYLFLNSKGKFFKLAHGSTFVEISKNTFEQIIFKIPSFQEQTAIAAVLSSADAVIAQYEAKLANLQTQKKALMQQLLTGKKRVKVAGELSANPAV